VPFVGNYDIWQFMVHATTRLAPQPPDNQRPYRPAANNDLAMPTADDLKDTAAHRARALFRTSHVKFPASSRSNRYRIMMTMRIYTPIVRIISGYSGTGKLGGCGAFLAGGNNMGQK